ncbi:MAG: extracellular solute-binding protein [bacterium]
MYNDIGELKKFAAEYSKIRPYVTVNIRQIRYEELEERFVNALADDVAPDIISVPVRELPKYQGRISSMPSSVQVSNVYIKGSYSKETVVEQITQPMPTVRSIQSAFIQTVSDDIVISNKVYGLPLAIDTLAIYYNKNLLDLSGIPQHPTTWVEFLDAVEKTTRFDVNGNIVQSGVALGTANNINNAPDILAMLLMQNRVDVTKNGRVMFASGMDKPNKSHPTFEALRFYTDFARPTKQVYSWDEKQEDALDSFLRGKSVFYFGFARDYKKIQSRASQLNLEVIPIPQLNPSYPANVANYWVESVVKKSKHHDVAWDFVRFMTTERNIRTYTKNANLPSPVRSHLKLYSDDPILGSFASQVLFAKNWFKGEDIVSANEAMANMIERYLAPYNSGEDTLERDSNIVTHAARVIQQAL